MLSQLDSKPVPGWLRNLTAESICECVFPLKQILKDSLYYPSSGFDGDPVKYLAGNVHSFIYVDYGHGKDEFEHALEQRGFHGYELVAKRSVTRQELAPRGWKPVLPTPDDGNPYQSRHHASEPYCVWAVFQRAAEVPADHGPDRFSLLYLCADGVAAFQALYLGNAAVPKVIALIQPGHGFGGNWTDFTDPHQILARSVLGNSRGIPELLLHGGLGGLEGYQMPIWPRFENHVCFLDKSGGGCVSVWRRGARP